MVTRTIDEDNRRQNKVGLTLKGEKTLKKSINLLNEWEEKIFDEKIIKKELLQESLKNIAIKTIELNQKEE